MCRTPSIESTVGLEAKVDKIPPPFAHPNPSSTRSAGSRVQEPAASTRQSPPGHLQIQRGGSTRRATSSDPSNNPPDQIELVEFPTAAQKYHDAVLERERRYDTKRAEKRRWLEEQDEMKFSHSIQFNAVPDWSNHYIAYSNLKKL